ncbi:acyl-CoA dehydrogenase family protein [Aeromicrobium panaciterrae]|uniref:acyl-CoA dehydrogenase family protein n=1 Tax=Aeromicrobium panaciterrae TaxID=363861 RepID=UPI0031D0007C
MTIDATQPTDPSHANDLRDMVALLRRVGVERIEDLATTVDRTQEFSPELWALLSDLGVPALAFPESQGGVGGSYLTYVTGMEEIARAGACAALYVGPTVQVAMAIARYGSPAQWRDFGAELVQGRALGAWAFTEPGTGSDPRQIRTRATRDGSDWLLEGGKMFISFADAADVALVFAKTGDDSLSAFLVDTDNDGWQPRTPIKMLAFGGMGTAPVAIDGLRLPGDALLGEEGAGFEILIDTEAEAKIRAAAICVGIGRRALEEAVRYASQREHRGRTIGDRFPTIQALIGEMSARVDAARALVHHAATAVDQGSPDVKRLAASTRIVASRMTREVSSDAMQICGAYGFSQEMVLERLYREGKFYEVGQGVIELQRIIVGKHRLSEFSRSGSLGT